MLRLYNRRGTWWTVLDDDDPGDQVQVEFLRARNMALAGSRTLSHGYTAQACGHEWARNLLFLDRHCSDLRLLRWAILGMNQ